MDNDDDDMRDVNADDDSNETENNEIEESDSESESSNDDDGDDKNEKIITDIQNEISVAPYNYDKHIELITKLRSSGELTSLRDARKRMSQLFPLTPQLWLEWISDEKKLATNDDERNAIIDLFECGVKDYSSTQLWLEYVQYSIGVMNHLGIDRVRQIFERALTNMGLHVSEGIILWESYREFELVMLQTLSDNDGHLNDNFKAQINKIFNIYKRQLSVPLNDMKKAYGEFEEWSNTIKENYSIDLNIAAVKSNYDKAYCELQKLKPYEESLLRSESPHLEQYMKYIEYEEANGVPPRVECIYERALTDNCLISDLWLKYTKYQDKMVVVDSMIIPIYERAVRNCPWNVNLWINYLRSHERLKSTNDKVMSVFEAALHTGFQQEEDYRHLWLAYLDYVRRKTKWSDDKEVENLRKIFHKANEHLSHYENGDPNCLVLQYLAKIEAKFSKNISAAREIWNDLLNTRSDLSSQSQYWIEYANLERVYGDENHYRKVLLRGLQMTSDWPETIGQLLITYEREEGNCLENYDEIISKYENVMHKITEKRKIAAETELELRKQRKIQKKLEKYDLKRNLKRKMENENKDDVTDRRRDVKKKMENNDFKRPFDKEEPQNKKSKLVIEEPLTVKDDIDTKNKDTLTSQLPSHGITYKSDGTKDLQTVFLSNLDFEVTEDEIREAFGAFGTIDDVRLVRNYKGLSKGYCYVEYSSIGGVREALKHDRMMLKTRPVFVSEMNKRQSFKYSTSLEKNKIFIGNLPFTFTKDDLQKQFEKFGTIKDIRIVTYRNGHSKGCAYLDYIDDVSAEEAVKKCDGMLIEDRNIKVTISNPNNKSNDDKLRSIPSLGSGILSSRTSASSSASISKQRINAPMIPQSLRVQRQTKLSSERNSSNNESKNDTPMNNNDFRNMLLGGK